MTKTYNNYEDLITFTRASKGHALRPVSYGDELVTNGTFDTDTSSWTAFAADLSVSGGELVVTNNATAFGRGYQGVTTEVGKLYQFSCDVNYTGDAGRIRLGTTSAGNEIYEQQSIAEDKTVVVNFVATTTTTYIRLGLQANTNGHSIQFDNASLKEVLFDQPDGTLTLFEHPNNVPRVEYDADGNRLGLLVEESRTNLITHSEDLTQTTWDKGSQTTVTLSTTTAPNGVSGCSRVQFTGSSRGSNRVHSILLPSPLNSSTHTVSAWVKSTSGADQKFALKCTHGGVVDYFSADFTATSEWQRFDFSQAFGTGGTSAIVGIVGGSAGNAADLEVWGFQFEGNASFPTSYIKTTGSTATRSADVASIPVADFGYNQSAGTVTVEFALDNTTSNKRLFSLNDGGTTERIDGLINSANSAVLFVVDGNSNVVNQSVSGYVDGEYSKVAASYELDNYRLTMDGATPVSDSSATVPTITTLTIGTGPAFAPINGHIKSIKYYPRRLTNAQLQEITS